MSVFWKHLAVIAAQPASIFTLLAVLLLILGSIYLRRIKFTTSMLVYIGLMLSVSIVLGQLRLFRMPQGGSITLGAMLPLLFISYRYGLQVGCLTGFLYGLINLLLSPYIVHPLQVLFDYPFPFMALGLGAIWPLHRYASTLLAFLVRLACHVISGVVFFASYAPAGVSPLFYSLTFNATYMVPEALICFILLKILPVNQLLTAMDRRSA